MPTMSSRISQKTADPLTMETDTQVESLISDTLLAEGGAKSTNISGIRAFISLAAILALLCLLRGGRVCGVRKEFTILVISSPILCLFDALVTLVQLLYYGTQRGPRSGVHFVASIRNQDDPPPSMDSNAVETASFQMLFLVQASGMPWTQFITACYASSYWTNYVLYKFGQPQVQLELQDEKSDSQTNNTGASAIPRPVPVLAALVQIALWTIALQGLLPNNLNEILSEEFALVSYAMGFAIIVSPLIFIFVSITMLVGFIDFAVLLAPVAGMLYLCSLSPRSGWPSIIEIITSAFGITMSTATTTIGTISGLLVLVLHQRLYPFYFTSYFFDNLVDPNVERFNFSDLFMAGVPYGVILVFISIAAGLSYLVARIFLFGKLADKLHLRHRSIASNEGWACMFMFAMNVTTAWLYYMKVYDPTIA